MAAEGPLPIGAGRIGLDVPYFFPFRGLVIGANHIQSRQRSGPTFRLASGCGRTLATLPVFPDNRPTQRYRYRQPVSRLGLSFQGVGLKSRFLLHA